MAEETQYTAVNGIAQISTANSNLDGSGTLGTVLTAASNGTYIKNVFIKSIQSTTAGMVRLFIKKSTDVRLLMEIEVPAITQASIRPTFETVIPLNFDLQPDAILMASTQNAETFNVIAEALHWSYYASSVRTDTTKYTPLFNFGQVATANSNLNGTGTISAVYTARTAATYKGNSLSTISVKATVANTPGMLRFYLHNGTTNYLFKEVPIPAEAVSPTDAAFEYLIDFGGNDFELQAGYSIRASTEVAQNFNVIGEGNDWNYYS